MYGYGKIRKYGKGQIRQGNRIKKEKRKTI